MNDVNKKEANIVKKRVNNILSEFDNFSREQLCYRFIELAAYIGKRDLNKLKKAARR